MPSSRITSTDSRRIRDLDVDYTRVPFTQRFPFFEFSDAKWSKCAEKLACAPTVRNILKSWLESSNLCLNACL